MGMDVWTKKGEGCYFLASVWTWHNVMDVCEELAPDLYERIEYPYTNDGSGLNGTDSGKLARVLDLALADGRVAEIVREQDTEWTAMPDEVCEWCDGTGTRNKPITGEPGAVFEPGGCNACSGKGKNRPFFTNYHTSVEEITEFAAFLHEAETLDGFEIW